MSALENQLIRLGNEAPHLRRHLRPILDRISSKEEFYEEIAPLNEFIVGLKNVLDRHPDYEVTHANNVRSEEPSEFAADVKNSDVTVRVYITGTSNPRVKVMFSNYRGTSFSAEIDLSMQDREIMKLIEDGVEKAENAF